MRGLAEKCFVVAGAGVGIGEASAVRLSEEGAKVVVADIDLARVEALAAKLKARGGEALALQYDQANEASVVRMIADAADHFGALHGLHANAADTRGEIINNDRSVDQMDPALWQRTMLVNVIGSGILIREAIPHIVKAGGGGIVLTGSVAGHLNASPETGRPAYGSSKAAVNGLCRYTASAWGSRGIRCNVVAPGVVLTDTLRASLTPDQIGEILATTRSTRLGEPADIASATAFLLSDDAAWVNGQVWSIDGGLTFRG